MKTVLDYLYCQSWKNCIKAVLPAALLAVACSKSDVFTEAKDARDYIVFYVRTDGTKAMINDEAAIDALQLPLYVTDASENSPVFTGTEVTYSGNGVWKSDKEWNTSKNDYYFFAYVYDAGDGSVSGVTEGTSAKEGTSITVTQPTSYSSDYKHWADFLMSYRVSKNGADKELVQLELERVTTGVELYMATKPGMTITLNKVEFRNIVREAKFDLITHATSATEPGYNGMKNVWSITRSENEITDYFYSPAHALNAFDSSSQTSTERFSEKYRIMSFLTVQQTAIGKELYLEYTAMENGKEQTYTATIALEDYEPLTWYRGHRIKYYLMVDSSVNLTGIIVPWDSVEYIEGTLLPDE